MFFHQFKKDDDFSDTLFASSDNIALQKGVLLSKKRIFS